MTPDSADVVECGWRSFLIQDYVSALRASLCVFGLNQSDFGSCEYSIVQQLHKRDMDQVLQVDALELLVASASALGKELDALNLFSRVIGLPIEFWDVLEPLSAANTASIQHSQLQQYVKAQARISKFKERKSELIPDWQDATTPAAAEDLKLSFAMIYLLASRFAVSPAGLLSSEVRDLWEGFYDATREFGEQLGSQDAGILPIQSLGTVQQHKLRNLYIRSLSAAGFTFRSFALFRASYPDFFNNEEIGGQSDSKAIRNLKALDAANESCLDSLWLTVSLAADRIHIKEWRDFATKVLFDEVCGGMDSSSNIELLVDRLLCRPAHLIGESYHAILSHLQSRDSTLSASRFADSVLDRVKFNTDSISLHARDTILRVSYYWGVADKRLLEIFGERTDRIAYPKALAGLPDFELLSRLKEHDFVDGRLGLKRDRLFAREAFIEQSRFLVARIQFARDCLAAGRISEAAHAIHESNEQHEGWTFDAESTKFDHQLDRLWNATVTSSQSSTAIPQFCINLATLLRVAAYEGKVDFVDRCRRSPRVRDVIFSFEFDALRHIIHPVHYAYVLCACVECLDSFSPKFVRICKATVETLLSLQKDLSLSTSNRDLVSYSVRQLRLFLVELVSSWPADVPEHAVSETKLILWIEMLEHTRVYRKKLDKSSTPEEVSDLIVPPKSLGLDSKRGLEHKVPTISHISFSVESESVEESCGRDRSEDFNQHEYGDELRLELEPTIVHVLGDTGIWIKTLFDSDGRLCWWAFASVGFARDLTCVAKGRSKNSSANRRIELETEILDATIEASFWRAEFESPHSQNTTRLLQDIGSHVSQINAFVYQFENGEAFGSDSRERAFRLANDAIEEWGSRNKVILRTCRGLAKRLLAAFRCRLDVASSQRIACGWRAIVGSLNPKLPSNAEPKCNQTRYWIDKLLNAAHKTHRDRVSEEFDLSPLVSLIKARKSNLVFSLDGPLASCPIEWLNVGNQLLYEAIDSCTSTFCFRKSVELFAHGPEVKSSNEMFFAAWESKDKPRARPLFVKLNHGLHALANEAQWACRSAFDSPEATLKLIENTLKTIPFSLIVVAGHGIARVNEDGYRYGVEVSYPQDKSYISLWDGRGDFHAAELVIVCSCVVGRLLDDNQGSFRGLYSNLINNGAHSFCGARWAVDTGYAVQFTYGLAQELLNRLQSKDFSGPFRIAKLVNHVRKELASTLPDSIHTLSAFSIWGIARNNSTSIESTNPVD